MRDGVWTASVQTEAEGRGPAPPLRGYRPAPSFPLVENEPAMLTRVPAQDAVAWKLLGTL